MCSHFFHAPRFAGGRGNILQDEVRRSCFRLGRFDRNFNLYTIYQQILIKRLRRQLAEKQSHSDILRNLASLDLLTGLYNRRFAKQRLAAEVSRSERKGHPLTVMTLDLNDFKHINNTYGHAAGDQVLQKFALCLNRVIRGSDLAVRLGGDEFRVLLPECTLEQVETVLGRLGSIELEWQGQQIPVTFSAGWRQYEMGDRPEKLLERQIKDCTQESEPARNPLRPLACREKKLHRFTFWSISHARVAVKGTWSR
jgi:diguanylate cyclase (GGDEF)-like protein